MTLTFEKFMKKLHKASSPAWQKVFEQAITMPAVMMVARYKYDDTLSGVAVALNMYFSDIVKVTSCDIDKDACTSCRMYAFCKSIFEQMSKQKHKVESNVVLYDDACAACEVMEHVDVLQGIVAIFTSSRQLETTLQTALSLACGKWTSQRVIVVAPKY